VTLTHFGDDADQDDGQNHTTVYDCIREYRGKLVSTWPVITEASHMLDFSVQTQLDFLEWIELGGVTLFDIRSHHLPEIRQIIDKYSDLPPDLADVTLLVVARELNISEIITLDSDFLVYRTSDRKRIVNLIDR
jgi:predicted nucleic acid-binding protein